MTGTDTPLPRLTSIAAAGPRRAWLCDVWGVLHDGAAAFPEAIEACRAFRRGGGAIVLVSNSPNPASVVVRHLRALGVPGESFDAIVTSGDVTRALVSDRRDLRVFHLGPDSDKDFFEGLNLHFASAAEAEVVVCTGLVRDETETPADYDSLLAGFAARGVAMICANPDMVVERGSRLIPCAGALAARYAALGQTVIYAGKPHPPIYERALDLLGERPPLSALLAIGDGIETDIKGAATLGIDAVYIVSRVHLRHPEAAFSAPGAVEALFEGRPFRPVGVMERLKC